MPIEQSKRTVQDVVDSVFRQFGDESGAVITATDVIRWINEAQREIVVVNEEVNQAIGQFASVAGNPVYDVVALLPDVIRIHSIMIQGSLIPHITFEEFQQRVAKAEDTGQPQFWYQYASRVNFWPSPSEDIPNAITVYYNKAPSIVSQVTDLLSVPDNYYEAVNSFCMAKAYELDENPQMIGIKKEDFSRNMSTNSVDVSESFRNYPTVREVDDY